MPGIEPGTFHMRSERSTTELHPHDTVETFTKPVLIECENYSRRVFAKNAYIHCTEKGMIFRYLFTLCTVQKGNVRLRWDSNPQPPD